MASPDHPIVSSEQIISRWGNGLAVRLTSEVARAAGLARGAAVVTEVVADGVLIRSIGARRLTLAEKLRAFDPSRHGGEALALDPMGAERIK